MLCATRLSKRLLLILLTGLATSTFAQDYAKYGRCDIAEDQRKRSGDSLNRGDREKLLYDLYIDLMSLLQEKKTRKVGMPKGLLKGCIEKKWAAYMTALSNGDPTFKSNFKLRWQTAELEEADGRFADALKSYEAAAKLEPDNAEAQMRYFKVWDKNERLGLNIQNQQINTNELQRFVMSAETRLKQVIAIKGAPREIKTEATEALCLLYKEVGKLFKSEQKLIECFESLLLHDPNHQRALRTLADYYLKKDLRIQASTYLSRLQSLGATSKEERKLNYQVLMDKRNFKSLLEFVERDLEKNPKDAQALEYKAIALSELEKRVEMLETAKLLRQVNPSSPFLRELDALKHEHRGDDFSSQGLPSNAMSAYQSATKLLNKESHNLYRIQRKIALIIFEHHKNDKFQNSKTVPIDMAEVVRFLYPALKEENPDPVILRTGVKAAWLGKRLEAGSEFCDKLFEKFPALNNRPEINDCADIWIDLGQKNKATTLFESAAKKPQYSRDDLKKDRSVRGI